MTRPGYVHTCVSGKSVVESRTSGKQVGESQVPALVHVLVLGATHLDPGHLSPAENSFVSRKTSQDAGRRLNKWTGYLMKQPKIY